MGQEHTQNSTMFAPKFKARAPTGSGVWTPKSQTPYGSSSELDIGSSAAPTPPPPPTRPVWTPQPSPALSGRKEFRPVHFESPTLPRRYTANQQLQQQQQQQTTTTIPPWSYTNGNCPAPAPRSSTTTNLSTPTTLNSNNSDYAETDYSNQFGPVAPSSSVSDKIKTFERSASTSELHRPFTRRQLADTSRAVYRPNEVTRPSYKSNGYVSEPEPNYDSDYSTLKYRTPNPLRVQSISSAVNVRNLNQDDKLYGTMPNPIKSAQNSYKNQPGRIENYTTGHSSVSEKEKKEWWDEVMDIFNGNLDQSKLSPLYSEGNLSRALAKESGYTSDSNIVFRKKELAPGSPLSPVEQRQAYKSLQAGGEPPLLGFRKPAPEKPKDFDSSAAPPIPPQPLQNHPSYEPYTYSNGDQIDSGTDVNIHFKTPIRHEYKQNLSEEELAIRQAEHMQKLYQEERRRKYLQELQDMNSRRHTDNFTPSQKSPIALNRYDDFPTDVTLKSLVGPKTVARALYNFQGQTSKELSFRKGDTIYIRRQIDPNWYEGEHNAMIGLLPASYVEIVSRDGARTPSKRPSEGQARAKYNFQAQSGVELSLNKGELVTLTRRVDGNWFEGKIANRKGIFPVSYVEVLTDIGAEDIAARTTTVISTQSTTNLRPNLDVMRTNINQEFNTLTQNGAHPPNGILKETRQLHKTDALHVDTSSEPVTYRALYKYRPQNSDELEVLEGDLVHVLEKCDDGWFVGTSQRTGCFGTFPGNYVERA
ncbi:sorbin and SH3 domain-containing protein 1 isoform X4 [Drosophila grimshawi]|uniref:sorbin and SH3 domain-containing protein 1 isoform X4 n=1 Tax=Drosophila grimshawi TaxID=7222 RepID=UPI0013EEF345|nr:sorbin and SH3 domain-containing protein 1 isoform X4 [Drosophila grimshawi]